jgi:hypothetical protein
MSNGVQIPDEMIDAICNDCPLMKTSYFRDSPPETYCPIDLDPAVIVVENFTGFELNCDVRYTNEEDF